MPRQYRDIRGQKFGRLTALRVQGREKNGGAIWWCRCDCGVEKAVAYRALTASMASKTQSCGCLRRDKSSQGIREWHRQQGHRMNPTDAALARNDPYITEEDLQWMRKYAKTACTGL